MVSDARGRRKTIRTFRSNLYGMRHIGTFDKCAMVHYTCTACAAQHSPLSVIGLMATKSIGGFQSVNDTISRARVTNPVDEGFFRCAVTLFDGIRISFCRRKPISSHLKLIACSINDVESGYYGGGSEKNHTDPYGKEYFIV